MKQNFILRFFSPSQNALSKLSTKEKGQIPIVLYGNIIFIIGFFATTITEYTRGTYIPMIFSIVTQLTFLSAAILMKKDKIEVAITIDTFGMLVAIAGIVFFMGMGESPLKIYRSACFIVVMAIFNQFFSIRRYQILIFLCATLFEWALACVFEFRALKEVNFFETVAAIGIGTIAIGTSLYGMMILWNQNQKITTEAVQGRDEADKSLNTIRKVFEQSSEGLEIGNQLNSEVQNVNTGIKNINELYQYLSSESENLSKQTQLVSNSSNEVINQVSKMQANINNQNDSLVGTLTEMSRVVKRLSKISEIAESRKSSMNEMIHSFDVQLSQIKSLENDVARVQESSKQIEAFVDTVNKIASQTGLLAMNASIEAAHAGTLGKGFSVIAQEIRKLSEQTSSNAAQITEKLNENAELVESATISANNCASYTEKSNAELHTTIQDIEEILAGISEMNASTDEVMSSLQKLEGDANDTDVMVKKSVEQINNQNNTIGSISVFANTLKQRVDSLDSVLNSIKTAMSNVNEVALKNTQTSKQITDSLKGI